MTDQIEPGQVGEPADWVGAHAAIALLLPMYGEGRGIAAAMALTKRAHSGLVKTRAQKFTWEEYKGGPYGGSQKAKQKAEFAPLPEAFWWAEGHEALTQNWVSGDFSTWIDNKFHLQAQGVEFCRADVLAMLPKEYELTKDAALRPESEPNSVVPPVARKGATGGRGLTYNHPYAAALAALQLKDTPLDERSELTQAYVGAVMTPYYKQANGKVPPDLDDPAKAVISALKQYWESTV